MRKLFYIGLESYESRYTLQLQDWNESVFKKRNLDYVIVTGDKLDNNKQIVTGSVLDAHGRSYWALTQTANLVRMMQQGEITKDDVIFFEDMFHPGLSALPYILQQSPGKHRPEIYMRCLAQTIDPDDFVNREGMFHWMRHFELMADEFIDGLIVASEEMVANLRIAGFQCPIYVSGLPFGKEEVLSRVSNTKPLLDRTMRVGFAARWDDEKQPHFFMDLAEEMYTEYPEIEFAVFCGNPELKSNRQEYVNRALSLERSDNANFKIYTGLKKNDYYHLLADSIILFNCALQDWVSNTISEADALGTIAIYPAYRSFPEVFANNSDHLYIPWSLEDARAKIEMASMAIGDEVVDKYYSVGKMSDYQDGTIDRTIDILEGNGEQYARNGLDYRRYVTKKKFE